MGRTKGSIYRLGDRFDQEIIALYKLMSAEKIANILPISRTSIRTRLKLNGIKLRPGFQKGDGFCLDCRKPCGAKKRCDFHTKLYNAERHRFDADERRKRAKTL